MDKAEQIKTEAIKWLLKGNLSFKSNRDAIGTEVLFSVKRRKADLLILSTNTHAIEIKSDFDKLDKLKTQLQDYYNSFDKVSVITTLRHVCNIKKVLSPKAGLIIFDNASFKVLRKAKRQKRLNKSSLLMFLPKDELTKIYRAPRGQRLSVTEIRMRIKNQLNADEIREKAFSHLKKRYRKLFELFLHDTAGIIIWDELRGLSGKINKLHG
ncbi:MAG: sce7726 family protein [Candidatus Aureabacteria bacterium]|nr:sce7726 family protein [Candidatus Auribacterota bacterium]